MVAIHEGNYIRASPQYPHLKHLDSYPCAACEVERKRAIAEIADMIVQHAPRNYGTQLGRLLVAIYGKPLHELFAELCMAMNPELRKAVDQLNDITVIRWEK